MGGAGEPDARCGERHGTWGWATQKAPGALGAVESPAGTGDSGVPDGVVVPVLTVAELGGGAVVLATPQPVADQVVVDEHVAELGDVHGADGGRNRVGGQVVEFAVQVAVFLADDGLVGLGEPVAVPVVARYLPDRAPRGGPGCEWPGPVWLWETCSPAAIHACAACPAPGWCGARSAVICAAVSAAASQAGGGVLEDLRTWTQSTPMMCAPSMSVESHHLSRSTSRPAGPHWFINGSGTGKLAPSSFRRPVTSANRLTGGHRSRPLHTDLTRARVHQSRSAGWPGSAAVP